MTLRSMIQGSSVSIVTEQQAGRAGFDSRQGQGFLSLQHRCVKTGRGATHPLIQCVPGALPPVAKRRWREADHSPPSYAEVENAWSYTSTPIYVLMAWDVVKHRDNFTLVGSTNFT